MISINFIPHRLTFEVMSTRNPDGTMPDPDPDPDPSPPPEGERKRHGDEPETPSSGGENHGRRKKRRGADDADVTSELIRLRAAVDEQREKKRAYRKRASLHLMVLAHVRRELDIYKEEIGVRIESVENPYDEERCALAVLRYRKLCEKARQAIVVPRVKCSRCKKTIAGNRVSIIEVPPEATQYHGVTTRFRVFCAPGEFEAYVADRKRQNEWLHGPGGNGTFTLNP